VSKFARAGLLPLLLLAGCASATVFQAYEGPATVYKGTGGTKTVVDGIEFWNIGTPPRKYQIIGVIRDSRPSDALLMAFRDGSMAGEVKRQGGDAVILVYDNDKYVGTSVNSYGLYNTDSTYQADVYKNSVSGTAQSSTYGGTSTYVNPQYQRNAAGIVVKYVE